MVASVAIPMPSDVIARVPPSLNTWVRPGWVVLTEKVELLAVVNCAEAVADAAMASRLSWKQRARIIQPSRRERTRRPVRPRLQRYRAGRRHLNSAATYRVRQSCAVL